MTEPQQRIIILGGGFGGLYTALRLQDLPWDGYPQPEIVLVDRHDRFLFTPLLYELITQELQTWEIAPPYTEILAGTNIRFLQAHVTGVDPETKQVHLENQPSLGYDRLVLALGSQTSFNNVPGAAEYALPFRTLTDAYTLLEKLRFLEQSDRDRLRIALVGGSYSGVELACKLADRLGDRARIRIIEKGNQLLSQTTPFNRQTATTALSDRHIGIDLETTVEAVGYETITLLYKGQVDIIPVDIVLWTTGNGRSSLLETLSLTKSEGGRILTTSMLQVAAMTNVFALGDLAECRGADGNKVPTTAQAAMQAGDYCAWNIWASLTNRPLLPFRYTPLGEMIALGADGAAVSALGLQFSGAFGLILRRLAYLYRFPRLSHQMTVGLNWIVRPVSDLLSGLVKENSNV